jgi:hypothetical protein
LIPERSPLNQQRHEDLILLHHIEVARELKFIDVIALYAHIPCGAASMKKLDAHQVINLLIEAKLRLKATLRDVMVGCFLHIDKGGGNKRTYFVSKKRWYAWQSAQHTDASVNDHLPASRLCDPFDRE